MRKILPKSFSLFIIQVCTEFDASRSMELTTKGNTTKKYQKILRDEKCAEVEKIT